jgi:hypothetical protein
LRGKTKLFLKNYLFQLKACGAITYCCIGVAFIAMNISLIQARNIIFFLKKFNKNCIFLICSGECWTQSRQVKEKPWTSEQGKAGD